MAELKTFLFTDISGSVRLKDEMIGRSVTERDMAFIQSILTPHRQRIEARLAEFGGRVVSTAGDGHFLVFDNTILAAQWAVSVQESHRDEPINTPSGEPVEVRISMHVGVPQVDPGDSDNFVGKSVDYAARLNDYATGGQILVSRSVMAILEDVGLEGLRLHLQGRRALKGIGNVEVHELLYDDRGPRPMRNSPKTDTQRQWTVIPTMGFGGGGSGGGTTVAGTALKRVGNYELEEMVGAGGMGDVYRARHVQFGRVRAVKVIKPQFVASGHDDVIRRFYNEIKAAGRLEHKNIVVAIDSSSPDDKLHYLVMEYVDGVSLEELVARHGPLGTAEAAEIIRQAARGLQYIHKNNMVHRDIKPSNLMVTLVDGDQVHSDSSMAAAEGGERAVVKILDLGLALLAADNQERLTRLDHKAMGTGMYMPPEQWKTTSVDIRADIYSLGCTLYHLLAGNPPFYDSDLRPEKAHEKAPAPPIQTGAQPIPKKLWDVLRKMLEKRPEERYSTPAEVSAALAPFAEGNHLAALVKSYEAGVTLTNAVTPTRPMGSSRAETRRSGSWFSGGGFQLGRRRLMGWVVPLTLMGVFAGATAWMLLNSRMASKEREAEELEELRVRIETSATEVLTSYAKTAARTASEEVRKRFEILTAAASDPELVRLVGEINAAKVAEQTAGEAEAGRTSAAELQEELQAWLRKLPDEHPETANSWFVQDVSGTQVARTPKEAPSLNMPYWFRDYFHGLGEDRDESSETDRAATKPIAGPHLSSAYYSTTSKLLKVAFSAPIRDGADGRQGEVIGVLAMSINLQDFTVLNPEEARGGEVILIDLRKDWIDGEDHGLILHHPHLEQGQLARVRGDLLREIDAARPLSDPAYDGADHFLSGYVDPVAKDAKQKYWGAVEPVRYAIKTLASDEKAAERFGWVVLVQRPMPAEMFDDEAVKATAAVK